MSDSEDEEMSPPCPEGKVFFEDKIDSTCTWNAQYQGWCCDKPEPSKLEVILQTCKDDPGLEDWRRARHRCQDLWRTNHEKLTYGREAPGFPEPQGDSVTLSSAFQTIMDFYMGQGNYSRWAEDALEKYADFARGYDDSPTAKFYRMAKQENNIDFLRRLSCLALIISHFFYTMREKATFALVGAASNNQNPFIKAQRETASSAIVFYQENILRPGFEDLYDDIQTNWERIKPPSQRQGLYIHDLESFTPEVIERSYTFIMQIVKRTCEIAPSE